MATIHFIFARFARMALACSPSSRTVAAWPWAYKASEQIYLPYFVVPAQGFLHPAEKNDGLADG